jgi:hypothetical protein
MPVLTMAHPQRVCSACRADDPPHPNIADQVSRPLRLVAGEGGV